MSTLALELNDTAITAVAGDQVLFREPGYAVEAAGEVRFGREAEGLRHLHPRTSVSDFWHRLSDEPLPLKLAGYRSRADLAQAQLAALWAGVDSSINEVICAVPAAWTRDQLGLLLGFAEEVGIPLRAVVDAPVAQTRRLYPGFELVAVDLSLHELTLSRIDQGEQVVVAGAESFGGLGLEAIQRTAADFVAQEFVRQTRFDPLQEVASEQALFARLFPELRRTIAAGSHTFSLDHGGLDYRITLTTEAWLASLRRRLEPLVQRLRTWGGVNQQLALQLNNRLADIPGLMNCLSELPGCTVFVLEPGATADGVLQRAGSLLPADGQVRRISSLPFDGEVSGQGENFAAGVGNRPTHLLSDSRLWPLSRGLQIGTEPVAGGAPFVGITATGVSRQHCTVSIEDGQAVIHDHSRFGTLLNGHRVEGGAVLQTGDVLKIGSPGVELMLVQEVEGHGEA